MPVRGLVALCALALGLSACGSEAPPAAADDQAREQAAAAEAAVESLRETVDALEERIADLERSGSRYEARLDSVTERLWGSLGTVRSSLQEARDESGSALEQVASALAEARAAARELTILENRFDYHLRSDHGGG
ncbi:MAG: hypothetical protein ACLGIB_07665 [Actinomycetota bacterium]